MEDFLKELKEFVYPEGWDDTSESSKNHSEPWNKGKKLHYTHGLKGKPRSEEVKQKIRETLAKTRARKQANA